MDKTSKLGLNLPEKGLRDWDVPINENFSLIDSKVAVLGLDNTFTGINTFKANIHQIHEVPDASIISKNPLDDYTIIPSEYQSRAFRVVDKNNKILGDVRFRSETNGNRSATLVARNSISGSEVSGNLGVTVDKNGNAYTHAPVPADSSNNTNIAVTSWVRKLFALLTGNNTFSGVNTFTNTIRRTMSNVEANVAPTENQYIDYISPYDKNGESLGYLGIANYTDGRRAARIGHTRKKSDGSYIYQSLDIGTYADGTVYTTAPTPPTNSNNNNIATTAYVNNKLQKVDALPSNADPNIWYFIKE